MPPIPRPRLDARAVTIMLALCTVWGVQQVASKVALTQGMPPMFQAVIRSLIAGPMLLLWILIRQGRPGIASLLARDRSLWPGLLTGAMFAAEFMLLFPGVQRTSASRAVVLLFTGVFFTAAGAHIFIPGERLKPSQTAGLLLAFAGVALTIGKPGPNTSLLGDAMVVGAAACWGLTSVIVKASSLRNISSEKVLAYQLFAALPLLAIGAALAGELQIPQASNLAWASLIYQGIVIAFASYLTWFWLVAQYPAGKLAAFTFLSPLLGVVAAWLLLNDPITWTLLAGLICVCTGLKLVNR